MTNEESGLELSALFNRLRGDTTMYRLTGSIAGEPFAISEQTMIRLGDRKRPFTNPVTINTLIGAAEAINRATPNRTTPWDMWIAHGIQFERTAGLWGRRREEHLDALPLLFAGWHTLAPGRLAAWNRGGVALLAEQEAEDTTAEVERLRRENDQLRAELAARDSTPPAVKGTQAQN